MNRSWKLKSHETAAALLLAGAALFVGVQRGADTTAVAASDTVQAVYLESLTHRVLGTPAPSAVALEEGWDLANIDHYRVDYWIRRFTTDKRGEFAIWLERKGQYDPMISAKLAEKGMPQDLVYLAMIESGFNPKALSHASASGIWQFIPETGQRYGLAINRAVDERNDPAKATDAALAYLSDLYDRFGSWYLASAAYNTGENRVGRIMRQQTGSEKGTDEDYYAIWDRLPRETRDYVPLMIAAARIGKDPAKYGFDGVEQREPWDFIEVIAEAATPLQALARANGTTVAAIRALNPQLKLDRTRNDQPSVVRLPRSA
jgi:membrane-bound lytic murein transglycosylase D